MYLRKSEITSLISIKERKELRVVPSPPSPVFRRPDRERHAALARLSSFAPSLLALRAFSPQRTLSPVSISPCILLPPAACDEPATQHILGEPLVPLNSLHSFRLTNAGVCVRRRIAFDRKIARIAEATSSRARGVAIAEEFASEHAEILEIYANSRKNR